MVVFDNMQTELRPKDSIKLEVNLVLNKLFTKKYQFLIKVPDLHLLGTVPLLSLNFRDK